VRFLVVVVCVEMVSVVELKDVVLGLVYLLYLGGNFYYFLEQVWNAVD